MPAWEVPQRRRLGSGLKWRDAPFVQQSTQITFIVRVMASLQEYRQLLGERHDLGVQHAPEQLGSSRPRMGGRWVVVMRRIVDRLGERWVVAMRRIVDRPTSYKHAPAADYLVVARSFALAFNPPISRVVIVPD
mmetsp:Transcript_12388/g.17728  ORF Transcript_12388/g.17728 Transcript_12388/m.17728 type:complete len:134 (-) Transcript_12388:44-445(-)|eukprot:scaffold219734_cov32-Tisochrysis_lutea.AAC.3